MMVMMSAAPQSLRQIRNVRKLTALRGVGEVGCQLVQFICRAAIALAAGCLRGVLQVGGDLRRHLLVFGRVRLLQLLQRAQHLRERRKLSAIGRLR
jgi:hypothetical protein